MHKETSGSQKKKKGQPLQIPFFKRSLPPTKKKARPETGRRASWSPRFRRKRGEGAAHRPRPGSLRKTRGKRRSVEEARRKTRGTSGAKKHTHNEETCSLNKQVIEEKGPNCFLRKWGLSLEQLKCPTASQTCVQIQCQFALAKLDWEPFPKPRSVPRVPASKSFAPNCAGAVRADTARRQAPIAGTG